MTDNHLEQYVTRRLKRMGFETKPFFDKFGGGDLVSFHSKHVSGQMLMSKPFTVRVIIARNCKTLKLPIANGFISSVPFKKPKDALDFVKRCFVEL